MFKEKMKGFLAGILVTGILMTSFTSFADGLLKSIQVAVNSVKIKVNGKNSTADNFVYDGRTYVQLRDVADLLGKDIGWDDATKTVSINDKSVTTSTLPTSDIQDAKKETIYVGDSILPFNYQSGSSLNGFAIVYKNKIKYNSSSYKGAEEKDNLDNAYASFMLASFYIKDDLAFGLSDEKRWQYIELPTKGKYKTFEGTYALHKARANTIAEVFLEIYADDRKVYSTSIKAGDYPEDISAEIDFAEKVRIEVSSKDGNNNDAEHVLIANPKLSN